MVVPHIMHQKFHGCATLNKPLSSMVMPDKVNLKSIGCDIQLTTHQRFSGCVSFNKPKVSSTQNTKSSKVVPHRTNLIFFMSIDKFWEFLCYSLNHYSVSVNITYCIQLSSIFIIKWGMNDISQTIIVQVSSCPTYFQDVFYFYNKKIQLARISSKFICQI